LTGRQHCADRRTVRQVDGRSGETAAGAGIPGRAEALVDRVWLWIGFNVFVLFVLALDLGVFHRKAHRVRVKEAAGWITAWVTLAILFGLGVGWFRGRDSALEFFAGYLVEQALSVDNIFVFVVIFQWFRVPPQFQHRVLFWGILGALVMRGLMIAASAWLLQFHVVIYIFGAFLVITGLKLAFRGGTEVRPERNPALRLVKRFLPVGRRYHGQQFVVRRGKAWFVTPLFLVLVLVETTDVLFAVDSIPAVFAVTHDPFIVYTSNVFAILGLRSMYFLLAGVIERFHQLERGLAVVLMFVGTKMLLSKVYPIPIGVSLGIIAGVLAISVLASLVSRPRTPKATEDAARDRA
jgi:tellurite resistance protein TerC